MFSRNDEHNFSENTIYITSIARFKRDNISLLNYSPMPVFTSESKRKHITKIRVKKIKEQN